MNTTFIVRDLLPIDKPNRNNRIYSRSCAEKIVKDFHDKVALVGELDTPVSTVDAQRVNLDRVSHSVEDIFIEGDFLKAKIKVLDTPMGNIVKELHANKVSLGFAMRGMGSVHDRTRYINDYNLLTVDITGQPSCQSKTDIVDQLDQIMDSMTKDGLI